MRYCDSCGYACRRRIRCKKCGHLVCSWCYNHTHNLNYVQWPKGTKIKKSKHRACIVKLICCLVSLLPGCTGSNGLEPTIQCTGHREFVNDFPDIAGSGTNFIFYHDITGNYQPAIHETWIDDDGFYEEQFVCVGKRKTRQEGIIEANVRHIEYVKSAQPDKAERAITCRRIIYP